MKRDKERPKKSEFKGTTVKLHQNRIKRSKQNAKEPKWRKTARNWIVVCYSRTWFSNYCSRFFYILVTRFSKSYLKRSRMCNITRRECYNRHKNFLYSFVDTLQSLCQRMLFGLDGEISKSIDSILSRHSEHNLHKLPTWWMSFPIFSSSQQRAGAVHKMLLLNGIIFSLVFSSSERILLRKANEERPKKDFMVVVTKQWSIKLLKRLKWL